jgi:hypothetical protein
MICMYVCMYTYTHAYIQLQETNDLVVQGAVTHTYIQALNYTSTSQTETAMFMFLHQNNQLLAQSNSIWYQ